MIKPTLIAILSFAFALLLCYGAMRQAEKLAVQQTSQIEEVLKVKLLSEESAKSVVLPSLGKNPAKTKRIDIGLAILATKRLPRSGRSRTEIAAYCGCSRERIRQIEERALRRLRVRCIFLKDERLRQAGEELLGRSVPL